MTSAIANRLSPDTREELLRLRRHRPPKQVRDAEKQAERAAVDTWLFNNGWRDWQGSAVAQCGTCAGVNDGARFVARRLGKDGSGPLTIRCASCVAKAMP